MLMIDSCHFVSVIEREQGLLKIVSAGSVLPIRKVCKLCKAPEPSQGFND